MLYYVQQVQDGGIFALREGAADNQHRDLFTGRPITWSSALSRDKQKNRQTSRKKTLMLCQ